jgi:hypothetical protein
MTTENEDYKARVMAAENLRQTTYAARVASTAELEKQYEGLYSALEGAIAVLGDEIEELQIKRNSIQTSLTETLRLQDKKQDLLSQSEIDLERIEGVWQANKIRMADWKCAKEGIAQMSTLPGFAPKVAP